MENNDLLVGSVKVKETQYGEIINIGLNKNDIEKLNSHLNSSGWVNIDLLQAKSGKKYIKINTFSPSGSTGSSERVKPAERQPTASEVLAEQNKEDDDLPF